MTPSELAVYVERTLNRAGLEVNVSDARRGYLGAIASMTVDIRRVDHKKVVRESFDQSVFEEMP